MSYLGKEYKLFKKDNCNDILKFLGYPEDQFEAISSFTPPEKFDKNGDTYTYYTESEKGPAQFVFKSGEEINYDLMDEPAKSKFIVDGNSISQTVKTDKHTLIINREYNGDELVVSFTADGYKGNAAKYIYKV